MKKIAVIFIFIISLGSSIDTLSVESSPQTQPITKPLFATKSQAIILGSQVDPQTGPQVEKMDSGPGSNIVQVTFGLFIVLLIIVGIAWFARRFGNFKSSAYGGLKIIGGLHMGTREKIVLVQVGEKQILLGVAPGRIQTLFVLETPLTNKEVNNKADNHQPPRFADRLASILDRSKNP